MSGFSSSLKENTIHIPQFSKQRFGTEQMGLDLVKFEVLLDTEVGCLVSILSVSGTVMNFLSLDSSAFFPSYLLHEHFHVLCMSLSLLISSKGVLT